MKLNSAITCFFLAATSPLVCAETVNYDELVSGDLSAEIPASFSLGVGVNTIAGSMSFYQLRTPSGAFERPFDSDPFFVNLALGTAISASNVSITFTPLNSNTSAFEWNWNLTDLSDFSLSQSTCYGLLNRIFCPSESPTGGSLFAGSVLASTTYMLGHGAGFQAFNDGLDAGGSFRYTVSFEVSVVPEAKTAALLLIGLLSLIPIIRIRRAGR